MRSVPDLKIHKQFSNPRNQFRGAIMERFVLSGECKCEGMNYRWFMSVRINEHECTIDQELAASGWTDAVCAPFTQHHFSA